MKVVGFDRVGSDCVDVRALDVDVMMYVIYVVVDVDDDDDDGDVDCDVDVDDDDDNDDDKDDGTDDHAEDNVYVDDIDTGVVDVDGTSVGQVLQVMARGRSRG